MQKKIPLNLLSFVILLLGLYLISKTIWHYCNISFGDYPAHINFVENKTLAEIIGSGLPHLFLHYLLLQISLLFVTDLKFIFFLYTILSVVTFIILKYLFIRIIFPDTYKKHSHKIVLLSLFSGAIYFPLYIKTSYLGIWSPITYHNPTTTWLKPFALATIIFIYKSIVDNKNKYLYISSLLLSMGCFIKPNFALSFLPTLFIVYLFRYIKLRDFLILVYPTVATLLFQFYLTYGNQQTSKIIFTLADAWKTYTPYIGLAILQNLFALFVFLYFYFKKTKNNFVFNILFVNLLVSLLQALLLAESGHRFEGMNFVWGYTIATDFAFLFALGFVFNNSIFDTKKKLTLTALALHAACGLYFIYRVSKYYAPYML